MSDRLSPAMRALLTAAAEHPDGRAYNTGQAGFMRTHDALVRRGLLAIVDGSAGVITDEGRAAIGRPLTAEQLAEREAARVAAEAAAVVRAERRAVLVGFGWRPRRGDAVTLADGTRASVGGAFGAAYQCRKCGQSHPCPDVVTERGSVLGAAECELSPTVETAVEYLTVRAADLDAAIEADPGYPANPRWAAEAAQLRAAAEQLAPAPEAAELLAPAPALVVCMFDAKPHPLDDECQRAAPAPEAAAERPDWRTTDCATGDGYPAEVYRDGKPVCVLCAELLPEDLPDAPAPADYERLGSDADLVAGIMAATGESEETVRDFLGAVDCCAEEESDFAEPVYGGRPAPGAGPARVWVNDTTGQVIPAADLARFLATDGRRLVERADGRIFIMGERTDPGLFELRDDQPAAPPAPDVDQRAAARAEEREQHNAPAAIAQRARNAERVLIAARGLGASPTRSVSVAALKEMAAMSDPDFLAALGAHIDAGHIGPVDGWGYSVEWAGRPVSAVTLVTGSPAATVVDK